MLKINIKEKKFKHLVFSDLKLLIEESFVSILGPSGCGKTTLLRMIHGLDKDFIGEILCEGTKSIVFQEPRLIPWLNIKQNISFGMKKADNAQVTKALKEMGLHDFKEAYPFQLSEGMAQRISFARALMEPCKLVLLDEPFAALDLITKRKLQSYLLSKTKNVTAVMATHDIEEAVFLSDKIYLISSCPSKIVREYAINLPKPRKRDSLEFIRIMSEISKDLRKEFS